jgi:hypothetical protein
MPVRFVVAASLCVLAAAGVPAQEKPDTPKGKPPAVYRLPPPEPPVVTLANGGGAPARVETFTDKATRCLHYATSIGVPKEQIDDYVKRCTKQ